MSYAELAQQAQYREVRGRVHSSPYWVQCFFDKERQAKSAYSEAFNEFVRDDRWLSTRARMPGVSFEAQRRSDLAQVALGFMVVGERRDPAYQDWYPSVVYLDASLAEATRRLFAEYHTRHGVIVHNGSGPGLVLVNLLEER